MVKSRVSFVPCMSLYLNTYIWAHPSFCLHRVEKSLPWFPDPDFRIVMLPQREFYIFD